MEVGFLSQRYRGLGKGDGIFIMENGGTDALGNGSGEGIHRGMAQNQNGGVQTGLPQFHGFQHGADAEEGAFFPQKPGHLDGAVAVGIGLDDGHHRHTGFFPDGVEVVGNGVQVDLDPGAVEIQGSRLLSCIRLQI